MTSFNFSSTKEPALEEIKKVIDKQNYYQRLGVSFNATQDDIKKAFRQLAKKYHPDRNIGNEEDAAYIMGRIVDAYDVLSNVESRKKYDQQLSKLNNKGTTSQAFAQNNDTYKSYTKSRKESEENFDDDIKDFLNNRRQLNKLYEEYFETAKKNIKYRNIPLNYLQKNDINNLLLEDSLKNKIIALLKKTYQNNNENPVRILKQLFAELEGLNNKYPSILSSNLETKENFIFLLISKEIIELIEKYTTNKDNKYYNDVLLYLFNKYLITKQEIQIKQYSDQRRYTLTLIPAYHSFVNQIISPIIEANKAIIDDILKQRGRH